MGSFSICGAIQLVYNLSKFAGQKVKIELVNQPTGWAFEAAYWSEIKLVSE